IAGDGKRVMQIGCQRVEPVGAAGRWHDARARRVEDPRKTRAESRARAGDDRDLAVEAERRQRVNGHRPESSDSVRRMSEELRPFRIDVPGAVLDDLRERLSRTRWPDQIPDSGWDYGTDMAYLQELCDHWRAKFDW